MHLADLGSALTERVAWLRRAVWVVLFAGVAAFVVCCAADDSSDSQVAAASRRPLAGFPEVVIRVTQASGDFLEWCALLAATAAARDRGLMDQTDLRGYDAMAFRFDEPSDAAFYMFHTRVPLSIAWFDADGRYVSQADMAPCPSEDPDACPLHRATRRYLHAVEVPRGGLGRLGIEPGATLSFPGGRCR